MSGFDFSASHRRLEQVLRQGVEQGDFPGAVAWMACHGEEAPVLAVGQRDPALPHAMGSDAVFWIASMTKPITTAAAMMLVDEGLLRLDDPVCHYLPALQRLATEDATPCQPTVRDLMRHTAGFTYGFLGDGPVHRAYQAAGVYSFDQTNQAMVDKLARLPLLYPPGSTFEYGMSTDVLGAVVEVCSGQDLAHCLAERVLAPLGMADTGFSLLPSQQARVARPFGHEAFDLAPPPVGAAWVSGGSGLWSTAADYGRFARMLLEGGRGPGGVLLSVRALAEMRRPQLPPGVGFGPYVAALGPVAPLPAMGQGFGLGLSIRLDGLAHPLPGGSGDFCWPGMSGCQFWCDPQHGLVVVVMMQAPSRRLSYRACARHAVYGGARPATEGLS